MPLESSNSSSAASNPCASAPPKAPRIVTVPSPAGRSRAAPSFGPGPLAPPSPLPTNRTTTSTPMTIAATSPAATSAPGIRRRFGGGEIGANGRGGAAAVAPGTLRGRVGGGGEVTGPRGTGGGGGGGEGGGSAGPPTHARW